MQMANMGIFILKILGLGLLFLRLLRVIERTATFLMKAILSICIHMQMAAHKYYFVAELDDWMFYSIFLKSLLYPTVKLQLILKETLILSF